MKTKLTSLIGIATLATSANYVSALTVVDADFRDIDVLVYELSSSSPNRSGIFDLTIDDGDGHDLLGFDPSSFTVTDAIIGFVFAEFNEGARPTVNRAVFNVAGLFEGDGSLGGDIPNTGFGSFEVLFNSLNFGTVHGSILLDIQADGMLDWEVSLSAVDQLNEQVSLTLYSAYLAIDAIPNQGLSTVNDPDPVPDVGTTSAMLGFAALVLVALRRPRRRS